ncbi:hypothetical protein ACFUTY_30055 [Streptomyces sp. NPDC057362]|uniref:hypothetical protein n=1 Tax=Streptomyces sp. NPDC057362 TaxID=3346106 RepID=UPI00363E9F54
MSLTGIAAVLALAGIPVSVLVARWQMRTTLAQAEASHRTALEAAKASHRSALEVTRQQAEAERDRWILDARRAEYRLFQNSLNQLRRTLERSGADGSEMEEALHEVHDSSHRIAEVGPDEVHRIAKFIRERCYPIRTWPRDRRVELWRLQVAPARVSLDEAINEVISGRSPANAPSE